MWNALIISYVDLNPRRLGSNFPWSVLSKGATHSSSPLFNFSILRLIVSSTLSSQWPNLFGTPLAITNGSNLSSYAFKVQIVRCLEHRYWGRLTNGGAALRFATDTIFHLHWPGIAEIWRSFFHVMIGHFSITIAWVSRHEEKCFVMWVIWVTSKHWELSSLQDEWAIKCYCLGNDVEISWIHWWNLRLCEGPQSRLPEFVCL